MRIKITYLLVFTYFLTLFGATNTSAQCVQSVNFNTWKRTGDSTYTGSSGWQITSSGTQLLSQYNTNYPRMFVGPDTLMNVKVTGTFRVEDYSDDDYVGFVFCFKETWDQAWYGSTYMFHEYYLFDWKKNSQTYNGYSAQEGFSLDKVNGNFQRTEPSVFPRFWSHNTNTSFQVLQSWFTSTNGWVPYTYYDFALMLSPTRATVMIDTDTIFDQTGCFEPGLFGFYNYSQTGARYLNFNYELYMHYLFEAQNICLGDTARMYFTDTSYCNNIDAFFNLDTFYWDLGDGTLTNDTNPVHYYDSAGLYHVSLIGTDIYGCTDSSTQFLYVHPEPVSEFVALPACLGDSTYFYDSTSVMFGNVTSWQWDFGDGSAGDSVQNPVHYYNQAGIFNVTLITSNAGGCNDTVEQLVTVYSPPTPSMTIISACEGHNITMLSTSTQSYWPINSIGWDVDTNGVPDLSGDSATQYFYPYGQYPITMYVTDDYGCVDSLTDMAFIYPTPQVDFDVPGVCFGENSLFHDSSTVSVGIISTRHWVFDSTHYVGGANPSFYFPTPGSHITTLIITSNSGCVDTLTKSVSVYHIPVASFDVDNQCEELNAEFINSSTSQSGNIIGFDWSFGDGGISNSANPLHKYQNPGLFPVVFEVTSIYGCQDTVHGKIRIFPKPQPGFAWNNVCEGDKLKLQDQSTIVQITPGGDYIVNWYWVFNGAQTTNVQNPTYNQTNSQTVDVKLYVTSNHGCVDSAQNAPQIYNKPKADFQVNIACAGDSSAFLDISKVQGAIIGTWLWDFGDGNTENILDPQHIYQNQGTYQVVLKVKSNRGCRDSVLRNVTIPETPIASFIADPTTDCSPINLRVKNLTKFSSGPLHYRWFVDGNLRSVEANPEIILENDTAAPVKYTIGLEAESGQGCVGSLTKTNYITVLPKPVAGFVSSKESMNPFEANFVFENTSVRSVRWLWDFADGNISTDFSPLHYYEHSGDYIVALSAWNEFGCIDSIVDVILVDPVTTMYVPNTFTPNGDGVNDTWQIKGLNEGKEYYLSLWDRWGNLILKSNQLDFEWNGKIPNSGEIAPNGAYTYLIQFYNSADEVREIYGTVNLMR